MLVHSRVALSAIALASLAALGACGHEVTGPATPATAAATAAQPTPSSTAEAGTPPEVIEAPTAPTVARTQGRVRIYSGPSDVALSPAPDTGRGSTVIQLNGTASPDIGTYVADGQGRTLYRFDKDRAKPSTSNCNGECATMWPPLLVKSPGQIYPSGINPKRVGYVERADGTCQVTIGGWPVYLFANDAAPGDVNGQGVGDTWFAISPTGERTRPLPGTPTTAAS
ncbi:COG4315 family predicted lipoprotein [Micromonospora chokoriensis]|uniref:Predicted lipoprotein with conserved Yx(FWY)xxD motif n=1 Tax=Micromonospora chokoriensis TaxID=356851 RepID=A0A1C4XDB8_9ACTN|nr:hypothetical protein [Micromonospora chokoriensis]SCF06446.1 Predicted lipoprotein with conserved Yx(FWY)xxD motif [Micromonospora chokoriensis]